MSGNTPKNIFKTGTREKGRPSFSASPKTSKIKSGTPFFPVFRGVSGDAEKMYHICTTLFFEVVRLFCLFSGGFWRCVPLVPHKSELSTYTRIHVKGGISYFFSRPRNMKKSGTCGTSSRERLKSGIFCVPHSNFYVVQKWYMWYAKWYISYLTGAL